MRKQIIRFLLALLGILSTGSFAQAWDGTPIGTISRIDVTAGDNYGFRVYLEGSPPICNGQTWAYLSSTDSNYNAYLAALLAARASNLSVELCVTQDATGYCHIGYIATF